MGIMATPPPEIELAQAQESMMAWLEAPVAAELTLISRNIALNGTNPQQEAFKLTFSEIRGIAGRALAQGAGGWIKPRAEINEQVKTLILKNPEYAPFKTATAKDRDPLLGE